jgi:hypothetical protein
VGILNIVALSVLLSLPLPATKTVERAFLLNSPEILSGLFTDRGDIPVSLPDPLSLADVLSPDQAYFVFKRIFSVYQTIEFFSEPRLFTLPGKPGGILTARWSFRNAMTGDLYPFRIFFFLAPETPSSPSGGFGREASLRIVEIRAEKL